MDYSKSINEQDLLHETKTILSLIYRDYICTPEERKMLIEKDKIKIEKEEELLKQKYNIDFKKIKENKEYCNLNNPEKSSNVSLVEIKKEKWYVKIINKILDFFKK